MGPGMSNHALAASGSSSARDLILQILGERGQLESDNLDALVAEQAGVSAKTVRNLRGDPDAGLFATLTTVLSFGYLISRGIAKASRVLEQ